MCSVTWVFQCLQNNNQIIIKYCFTWICNLKKLNWIDCRERRRTLRENWYFDCFCKRCSDPTEFESYLSAMKCQSCSSNVLPINPLDQESDWKCKDCQTTVNPSQVLEIVATLLQEKENVSKTDLQVWSFFPENAYLFSDSLSVIGLKHRYLVRGIK